jgi:predicted phosphodiesterase
MRYAVLSDIHGNLEALRAVVAAGREEGARVFLCLGDIVGYGANPNECIDVVEEEKMICLAGNHDWAVLGKLDTTYFNTAAKAAVEWTQRILTEHSKEFLNQLQLTFKNEDVMAVHGTLNQPQEFIYMFDLSQSLDTFYLMDRPICFVGHTHVPRTFVRVGDKIGLLNEHEFTFEEGVKYIVNVGSVGQPRDGQPEAAYCMYDPDLNRVNIKRVPYDIKTAQEKIFHAGLPEILAQRLAVGQ